MLRKLAKPLRALTRNRRREKKFRRRLRALDSSAQDVVLATRPYTLLNPEKLFAFIQAVRYIDANRIAGDIVECGVWRGGAIMAAAMTLRQVGGQPRDFWLYDTFSGMSAPTEKDRPVEGTGAIDVAAEFEHTQTDADSADWCRATLEDVKRNIARVDYDPARFHYVKGKVEDTLPATLPGQISILRLDTDWYESTQVEMEHLFPLLVPGGVLIIDDYFRWAGNRDAVDEYLQEKNIPLLLNRVANSAIGVYAGPASSDQA